MISSRNMLIYAAIVAKGDFWRTVNSISNKEITDDDNEINRVLSTNNHKCITILDDDYPEYLKNYYMPPLVLFYEGDISLISEENIKHNIGVVGSRQYSDYGEIATKELVTGLCKKMTIVSGGAIGIDTISHMTALENGGKTISVLPSGLNNPYPKTNSILFQKIKKTGLIISEYPDNVVVDKNNFSNRNRLIAYLSSGVLVTEAHEASGTLITAGCAATNGIPVFCVPYTYASKSSCNRLIRNGATLVRNAEDILFELDQ